MTHLSKLIIGQLKKNQYDFINVDYILPYIISIQFPSVFYPVYLQEGFLSRVGWKLLIRGKLFCGKSGDFVLWT